MMYATIYTSIHKLCTDFRQKLCRNKPTKQKVKPLQAMNIAHIYVNGMIRLSSTNGLSNTHTNRSRKVEILTEFRMRFMLLNNVQSLDQVGNRWSSSAANLFIT